MIESEHLVAIALAAALSTGLFGATEFLLNRSAPGSYIIDPHVIETERKRISLETLADIDVHEKAVSVTEKVIAAIGMSSSNSIAVDHGELHLKAGDGEVRVFSFLLNIPAESQHYQEVWGVQIIAAGHILQVDPDLQRFGTLAGKFVAGSTSIPSATVLSWLTALLGELKRIESGLMRSSVSVNPESNNLLPLFVFARFMDSVGSPVSYFLPVSGSARLLTGIFAFVKFLFLGGLVSVFAAYLATQKMQRENPPDPTSL